MQIISHRGYWLYNDEKNTEIAFRRSFDLGFGTETDVRDCKGEIVISHDIPLGEEMTLVDFLGILDGRNLLLALNIKSDGITQKVSQIMEQFNHSLYFMFDMSIPDYIYSSKHRLKLYTGCSEYVKTPILLDKAEVVWLDMFEGEWYNEELLANFVKSGKKVCIVSPDLHKREHLSFWSKLRQYSVIQSDDIILCTDSPKDALEFFEQNK